MTGARNHRPAWTPSRGGTPACPEPAASCTAPAIPATPCTSRSNNLAAQIPSSKINTETVRYRLTYTLLRWCLYDGHCHPFLTLRDGTHPLAARTCEPRPLAQARQIRPAAPVGALRTGARPTDRFAGQPKRGVSRIAGQTGPGPRPYAHTRPKPRKQGRRHYPHPPCRIRALGRHFNDCSDRVQIVWFCVRGAERAKASTRRKRGRRGGSAAAARCRGRAAFGRRPLPRAG